MKIYTVILTALAALAITACSTTQPANQTPANTANTANTVNQTNQAIIETKPAGTALSPTETLKALNEASRKKDTAAIKNYLSQGTLELLEQRAKEENKTVDEILKEEDDSQAEQLPETGGEKIEGDKATVEVKNPDTGAYEPFPLVKENGMWKVALDVYLKELEKRFADEMNEMPENSSNKPKANKR